MPRINIAVAGGQCTGKSTLAAYLFAKLKEQSCDFDLITEQARQLKKEFGGCRNAFDRFYLWRQQEREELRSMAEEGFITDTPLFYLYVSARQFAQEPRDNLAIRELFRMCLEIKDRYQLIVMAKNPDEIPYQNDACRVREKELARTCHKLTRSFVEHFWPERLLLVKGSVEARAATVLKRLEEMKKAS